MKYVGHITVEDASGCPFDVHEYRERRLLKERRRFILETGEPVMRLDPDYYVIATTGETLVKAD